ncbi:MAG: 50S ribosomal protein L40e [Candidatus Woesearchaeota archaeon]|nr:50S ribosomal protein L40e [Candidatus Woesearchaeota archaeon]MDO8740946.1 50S ribosomal protein L40e [Candidatus Woesearchaeota archaeon]
MVKFPEADMRIFRNKFVCRRCNTVISSSNLKIIAGKIKCRKCHGRAFRPKRKK